MPYARNGDVRIFYESEGHGPPLLLHQGDFVAQQFWMQTGYVHALHEDFRIILMDPRGIGRSSKPHEPEAYRRSEQVGDILAVLDDLGLRTTHFWGHSAGAWKGWFCAKLAPERFRSLVLGGMAPYITRSEISPLPWGRLLKEEGMEGLVSRMEEALGPHWREATERMLRSNDIEALIASYGVSEPPEAEKFLPTLQVPILGYAGTEDAEHDDLQRACEMAPLGRFVSLEGLDHGGSYFERERILPQAVAFMQEVEAGLTRAVNA